jgi:predicted DNA-binding transcriptional regulator YafY
MLNRVKTLNERIYYNVDTIHSAITSHKQISFKYFDLSLDKTKKYRKNAEEYIENPISLIWDDENYYLVSYNLKHNSYVHYRVDRMESIKLLDFASVTPDTAFNPADYLKKTFSMFSGKEEMVSLKFDMSLVNVVFDRFGLDITPFKEDDNTFIINTRVNVSHQFYGWIASLGSRCTILSPQNVKDEFANMLEDILKNHK